MALASLSFMILKICGIVDIVPKNAPIEDSIIDNEVRHTDWFLILVDFLKPSS